MDLITATKQVKADSKKQKKNLFYIILVDDEFEVRTSEQVDIDKDDIYSTWRGGVKIDAPEGKDQPQESESIKDENNTTMKTKTKERPAVKKSAPKKEATPKVKTIPRGNNMFLTEAEWKKVDAILAKEELTFSAWSRGLVQAKIK